MALAIPCLTLVFLVEAAVETRVSSAHPMALLCGIPCSLAALWASEAATAEGWPLSFIVYYASPLEALLGIPPTVAAGCGGFLLPEVVVTLGARGMRCTDSPYPVVR